MEQLKIIMSQLKEREDYLLSINREGTQVERLHENTLTQIAVGRLMLKYFKISNDERK